MTGLVEKSIKNFNRLHSHKLISESKLKYFTVNFKKVTNLGKFYFLTQILKKLANVPGGQVISNCGSPTEKPVMQDDWSYIRDTGDFPKKSNN